MRILRSSVYFPVLDVRTIGDYYRNVLGFACEYSAGDPPEFALYKRGEASIMFRRVASSERICPNEAQGGAWDVFLWVDDAEASMRNFARGRPTWSILRPSSPTA